ncbi:MAG: archease [Desulfarculaceae bacterium]|nr:archease [Desulfarculaceae bacterium]MCF8049335.1 archease [Desulfarculaceae bacterium]MCF8065682.1 archease [Desulfarculaceae bacterium]MCF8099561.1 archease [Desulfarculaceae bacterium]MCF8124153.1 archease [Desulfarculaceae bacterium]
MTSGSGTMEHTADLGLWVQADSLEELFAGAPASLAELMVKGPRDGQLAWLPVSFQGVDHAELLVQLLSEVVYLWDAEGLLTVAAKISELTPGTLEARLGVIPADYQKHRPNEAVKAVTYHQASVEPMGSCWRAQVILDL